MFDMIAFDADDTLWQNEIHYKEAEEKLIHLLAEYQSAELIAQKLFETETRNIASYGYGIKSYTLSMIETAIELTKGKISAKDIQQIIAFGREMLAADVEPLKGARETIRSLSTLYTLMIITKGDLLDQERKVARSGMGACFEHIEIVSEKTSHTYKAILAKHKLASERFLMIGNSLKSDVLPVVAMGGAAVYIPNGTTWAHEAVSTQEARENNYYELEDLGQLPAFLEDLRKGHKK